MTDGGIAKKCGVELGMKLMQRDFVLTTDEEAQELRESQARDAMQKTEQNVRFVDKRPVPSGYIRE